jgi:hypothetical protein
MEIQSKFNKLQIAINKAKTKRALNLYKRKVKQLARKLNRQYKASSQDIQEIKQISNSLLNSIENKSL